MEFSEFYERDRDRCLSAVAVVVHDRGLAEDLVAEAFARAFARWSKLDQHPDPRAWVVRTALNVNVSRWRRRRREIREPAGWTSDVPAPASASPLDDLDDLDDRVAAALATLPLRQRQVIALRILLDLDTARTAAVLDIAQGTVTAHLHRAVTSLKATLTPLNHTDELEIRR
jgi:RNA polymerase sigma factor (sigma-70 family)